MRISKETGALVDKMIALQEEIDDRIREESGGLYHLSRGIELTVQLSPKIGHKHDLTELEACVGPIHTRHEYEDGTKSYHFMLGDDALGVIVMPADTIDSRTTGGEADDVCIDKEA